ncbi:MAG: sulfate/thiosulfate ABC transporter permease CysW, partial [Verrucomicrobia bacterium]|nr:sulfate/thiosulfate ABC transporter permease CysW [Verrucomicrobiota bacterium]
MTGAIKSRLGAGHAKSQRGAEESLLVKWLLIGLALLFCLVFLLLPLLNVFAQAFSKGLGTYVDALKHPDSWA